MRITNGQKRNLLAVSIFLQMVLRSTINFLVQRCSSFRDLWPILETEGIRRQRLILHNMAAP